MSGRIFDASLTDEILNQTNYNSSRDSLKADIIFFFKNSPGDQDFTDGKGEERGAGRQEVYCSTADDSVNSRRGSSSKQ